jgi:hypothetical protein
MTRLENYNDRYGSLAGPKIYHALQSRAAYIGASRRRRREIEALTGKERSSPRVPSAPEADRPGLFPEIAAN